MHTIVLAILASSLSPADVPPPEEVTIEDHTDFGGRWEVVSISLSGMDATPQFTGVVWAFEGDKAVYSQNAKVMTRGTIRLGERQRLRTVEMFNDDGERNRGVYRVRGDSMEVAFTQKGEPATEFTSEVGSGVVLATLRRVRK